MITVPFEIQQRAHDAAYVLLQDFADRLPLAHRVRLATIWRTDPLGWRECGYVLRLWSKVVAVRV